MVGNIEVNILEKYINRLVEKNQLTVKIDGRPIDLNYVITGGTRFQMLALNLISNEKKQAIISGAVKKMRDDYANRMDRLDEARQKAFNIQSLRSIRINIWDEYPQDETYAYVDEYDLPLTFQRACLERLRERLQEMDALKCQLKLLDTADEYPGLIGSEHAYSLTRHWELSISPVNEEVIDKIVHYFEKNKTIYEGIPMNVYSES